MENVRYWDRVQAEEVERMARELNKVVVGKDREIRQVLCAMLAGGHILLEDVPGVGKTTLAVGISRVLDLSYQRIQFTPDVLPSDVTGFMMYNKKTNEFEYKEGAVMTHLLLADEINRTSSKTQSALLEAMEEGSITVDAVTYPLPEPFFVLATENPFGSAGTQRLPESQLDRFMIRISLGYPDPESELQIYQGRQREAMRQVQKVLSGEEFQKMRQQAAEVELSDRVGRYLTELVNRTRKHPYIELGISPRGGIAIVKMAKAHAFLQGRSYVIPEDIADVWGITAAHRIVLGRKGKLGGISMESLMEELLKSVPMPE